MGGESDPMLAKVTVGSSWMRWGRVKVPDKATSTAALLSMQIADVQLSCCVVGLGEVNAEVE